MSSLYTTKTYSQLITNLNVGIAKRDKYVKVPVCNFNEQILSCLCRLGYIESYQIVKTNSRIHFLVFFKFDVNGRQCLQNLRSVRYLHRQCTLKSKHFNNYIKSDKIFKGTWLVKTNQATILTDDEALLRNLSGNRFLLIN